MWRTGAPLVATAAAMIIALPLFVMGLVLDDRTISGAAAWLKPVKFATSIAIYTLTLAWIFTWLPRWARMRTLVGWTTAVTLTLEMVLIALQAARGQASHFNNATPFDALVFTAMGIAIVVNTLAGIAVAAALWRERLPDRTLGAALRLGMSLTMIGAVGGGLMLGPTARQQQEAPSGHRMPVVGGHSVGGLDGGRGLPLTRWSTEHGDLRVAHFVGFARRPGAASLRSPARATRDRGKRPAPLGADWRGELRRAVRRSD